MMQRYEYTVKEISNGWIVVTVDHYATITQQYFSEKTNALEYVIKLLGEIIDESF